MVVVLLPWFLSSWPNCQLLQLNNVFLHVPSLVVCLCCWSCGLLVFGLTSFLGWFSLDLFSARRDLAEVSCGYCFRYLWLLDHLCHFWRGPFFQNNNLGGGRWLILDGALVVTGAFRPVSFGAWLGGARRVLCGLCRLYVSFGIP